MFKLKRNKMIISLLLCLAMLGAILPANVLRVAAEATSNGEPEKITETTDLHTLPENATVTSLGLDIEGDKAKWNAYIMKVANGTDVKGFVMPEFVGTWTEKKNEVELISSLTDLTAISTIELDMYDLVKETFKLVIESTGKDPYNVDLAFSNVNSGWWHFTVNLKSLAGSINLESVEKVYLTTDVTEYTAYIGKVLLKATAPVPEYTPLSTPTEASLTFAPYSGYTAMSAVSADYSGKIQGYFGGEANIKYTNNISSLKLYYAGKNTYLDVNDEYGSFVIDLYLPEKYTEKNPGASYVLDFGTNPSNSKLRKIIPLDWVGWKSIEISFDKEFAKYTTNLDALNYIDIKYHNVNKVYCDAYAQAYIGQMYLKKNEAKIGSEGYATLADAITAANKTISDGTAATVEIDLQDDITASGVIEIMSGVTLDLNGHTLTASGVVTFNGTKVVDSSNDKAGLLKVAKDMFVFNTDANNPQMPVYNGTDGYVFADISPQEQIISTKGADIFELVFRPSLGTSTVVNNKLLADGGDAAKITIGIRLEGKYAGGNAFEPIILVYDNAMIDEVYSSESKELKAFYIKASGVNSFENVKITPFVQSKLDDDIVWNGTTFEAN